MTPPLPLAPRPHSGEAVSSWIGRIGARYDITADALIEHVLDRPGRVVDVASTLDYRAAPDLEAALANATRFSAAAIGNLRIAGDDGSNSCWHRWASAWCPICIRADLADYGELDGRAIWRLGFCVVCSEHNVPLEDSCCRCSFEDRCHFDSSGGLLGLVCNTCNRPQGSEPRRWHEGWQGDSAGAFGTSMTPSLNRLIGELQTDLQTALTGARPSRSGGGFPWSATGLVTAVLHLTFCVIMATGVQCEPRIILPKFTPGEAFAPSFEPITPAALSTRAAYGVIAIAAAVLRSLGSGGGTYRWRPGGAPSALNVSSFLEWLPAEIRGRLKLWSIGWEEPAGSALQAAIADIDGI